jgi:hypothetical protein
MAQDGLAVNLGIFHRKNAANTWAFQRREAIPQYIGLLRCL